MKTIEEHPALEQLREDLAEIEAKVNTYSLADAIREGSSRTDQKIGGWIDASGEVCALSAAYLAARARGL